MKGSWQAQAIKRGVIYLRMLGSQEPSLAGRWRELCTAYTDMLGCSISRFSRGLVSSSTGALPPAVKQGGGVMNQLSSRSHAASSLRKSPSSGSASAVESREEQEEQRRGRFGPSTSSAHTSTSLSPQAPAQASATKQHIELSAFAFR